MRSVVVRAARPVSLTEAKATASRARVALAPGLPGLPPGPGGPLSDASAAGPASPHSAVDVAHAVPEPTSVVIVPAPLTRRTRLSVVSATRKPAPVASAATVAGPLSCDSTAGP